MMHEPVEERLSRCIDALNAGLPVEVPDAELAQLAADAVRAKEALTMPAVSESLEERVWQRVRAAMQGPAEAPERREGRIGARAWSFCRRWAVAAALVLVGIGAFAGMYAPRLAKHRQDAVQVPAVRFLRPGNGQTVSGEVQIEVDRAGRAAPRRVELQLDGRALADIRELPSGVRWDTRKASPGPHVLSAVAYGADGRVWAASVAVRVINNTAMFGRMRGLVLTADGKPAGGTQVRVAGPRTLVLRTQADGAFWVDRVPAGRYEVAAAVEGQGSAVQQVVVREGEQADVTLRLPAQVAAAGGRTAQDASRPAQIKVRVMFPFDGALLHGVVPVVLELDPAHKGVEGVHVEVDGRRVFSADRAPYEWTWDTGEVADGQHDLTFRVRCRRCGEHVLRARVAVANEGAPLGAVGGEAGTEDEMSGPRRPWVNAPPNPR